MLRLTQAFPDLTIQATADFQEITDRMEVEKVEEIWRNWLRPQEGDTEDRLSLQHPSTDQEYTENMEVDQEEEVLQHPLAIQNSRLLALPNEILQDIAIRYFRDVDIARLGLSCKEAYARILSVDAPVWRARHRQMFDVTPKDPDELHSEYSARSIVLRHKLDIKKDSLIDIHEWLYEMLTMLWEAMYVSLPVGAVSKTYELVLKTVMSVDFLNRPVSPNPSDIFYSLHLCLTALALDDEICTSCYREDYCIVIVYSVQEHIASWPFIDHQESCLWKLMHFRNFWQRHLMNPTEATFYGSFSQLPKELKPKVRKTDGSNPKDLSKSWLGYYSCIHPLPHGIGRFTGRQANTGRQSCADLDSHLDQVELMTLEIESRSSEHFWPATCSSIIPVAQDWGVPDSREYFKGCQNTLGGASDASNPMFGFTEPIQQDFGGIFGWIRICFTISERVGRGQVPAWVEGAEGWVHGYEAMLIPGGRLMIGRWVDLKDESGNGPFIFWDV
ncbi:Major facilitator superfamily domain general substrate transporter [Penicillium angulare]|uniref:Major facilitator superfamily domain general substrate transporter n=1 Tax=Penicillium angulare TaxID=116970 RepID=A0A9W9G7L1_9EURO|nr:Major facilitator superfamily domain general substrate transporter [Penicillium angulare]